jgi:hypothetical protein
MPIFVEITLGAIPVAKLSANRYAAGHGRQVSYPIQSELGVVDPSH